ncbi:MAG: hypothetical protein ABIG20_02005 [archaeon]
MNQTLLIAALGLLIIAGLLSGTDYNMDNSDTDTSITGQVTASTTETTAYTCCYYKSGSKYYYAIVGNPTKSNGCNDKYKYASGNGFNYCGKNLGTSVCTSSQSATSKNCCTAWCTKKGMTISSNSGASCTCKKTVVTVPKQYGSGEGTPAKCTMCYVNMNTGNEEKNGHCGTTCPAERTIWDGQIWLRGLSGKYDIVKIPRPAVKMTVCGVIGGENWACVDKAKVRFYYKEKGGDEWIKIADKWITGRHNKGCVDVSLDYVNIDAVRGKIVGTAKKDMWDTGDSCSYLDELYIKSIYVD